MTLSNFDWTDKDSMKWFILLPGGHEGPYSMKQLIQLKEKKKLAGDVKVWAEGLVGPLTLTQTINMKTPEPAPVATFTAEPPTIPEEDIPEIPLNPVEEEQEEVPPDLPLPQKQADRISLWPLLAFALIGSLYLAVTLYARKEESFHLSRASRMSPEIHARILSENSFDGWRKQLFFKEYLPQDHSIIWLVTTGYQKCEVEATFTSIKDKLLSMKDEKVSFKSKGALKNHLVEFSSFEFTVGTRLIPGLYEMDVKATQCQWGTLLAKIMNAFRGPDSEYLARTKVVLFSQGAAEYNNTLDNLLKKKDEIFRREKDENYLFWQDLYQKFQTLEAISLQIEQHFLDFLEVKPSSFKDEVKPMVNEYTKKFGSFLTSFVVENENYFKTIGVNGASKKRNYELMVRLTSKKVGLESMKFIEEFQSMKKKPTEKELVQISDRVKKTFSALKKDITEKLSQVSEDQESLPEK